MDLPAALAELAARFGVRRVRADCGGTLNGALLRAGLVSEASVLVHPQLTGGTSPQGLVRAPDLGEGEAAVGLALKGVRKLRGGVVWLRYAVRAAASP